MENRPPLKLCPNCRITMLASKSSDDVTSWDLFTCLECEMVIESPANSELESKE